MLKSSVSDDSFFVSLLQGSLLSVPSGIFIQREKPLFLLLFMQELMTLREAHKNLVLNTLSVFFLPFSPSIFTTFSIF